MPERSLPKTSIKGPCLSAFGGAKRPKYYLYDVCELTFNVFPIIGSCGDHYPFMIHWRTVSIG
nr:hypothetical protein Q903MT_gene4530 [Picea sitchensis]